MNFRDDQKEESEAEEAVELVSRRFCWKGREAVALYSDSERQLADEYIDGGRGFIKAIWYHDNASLETEMPISELDGKGGIKKLTTSTLGTFVHAPKAPSPKPAGKSKASPKQVTKGKKKEKEKKEKEKESRSR